MNNPKIEAYCESMDNAFLDYMTKNCNSNELSTRISSSLSKISTELKMTKEFKVILINGKSDFCGIKVYPDITKLKSLYANLDKTSLVEFCKDWLVVVDNYIVEIDENCFDKHRLNFTNKELTAMLLHELGHVAFSSTIPEVIYNSYMIHREELKYGRRSVVCAAQQLFYTVPTLIACGMHVLRTGIDGRREEYIADKLFGIDTYKPYLYSAIDKIIRAYGTTTFTSNNDYKKTVDNLVAQNNINIKELATRRRLIKDDLLYQSANTHSRSVRKAYLDIISRLGIGYADRYTNAIIATESVFERIDNGELKLNGILNTIKIVDTNTEFSSVLENAFSAKECCCCDCKCMPKLPTDYDLEMIALNVDKIHSNIDRLATLDELYKLKEKLDTFTSYVQSNGIYDTYKFKIDRCSNKLNELIDGTKSKEVSVTKFSEILKYPTDYSK